MFNRNILGAGLVSALLWATVANTAWGAERVWVTFKQTVEDQQRYYLTLKTEQGEWVQCETDKDSFQATQINESWMIAVDQVAATRHCSKTVSTRQGAQ